VNILTLDFETYFDDEYTLKKLTTEHYIRDPRFEVLMCGIRTTGIGGNAELCWHGREDIASTLSNYDWDNTAVLCHHAHFDALILSHHYGIKPRFLYDTLSMARLQLGNHVSVALGSLAAHYGLAAKSVPYDLFRGKHWADLQPAVREQLGAGCLHDIELTWDIFQRLAVGFPAEEYQIIDMTVRMFTEPKLEGDVNVFGAVWTKEAARKERLLRELELEKEDLHSAERFAELLRGAGVDPETKSGKSGPIYAFAKTDDFMQGLLESEDEYVRTLAEARLGQKSTLDQTRAERLGFMATRGPMPVYLKYCGAHTTRWAGGDKLNWQNFKRGSDLRKGIGSPDGHTIVKADKSQIECRILNYVAEQWDVIERFKRGEDPYLPNATKFYGREITKANPAERGFGKQLELSCGYGAGADTIIRTAKRGTYGPPIQLTAAEGLAARDVYRSTHPGVVDYWRQASRLISALAGTNQSVAWGPMEVSTGSISLNGIPIWYPELHFHRDEDTGEEYWRYKSRYGFVKLYGGKLVENVVQFMSRVDMSQSLLRILSRTNIRPAQLEHDAAVWVVPNDLVEPFKAIVETEMTRAPTWLPGIPLACEISTGETM
jgi:DNA polymerase family A